MRYDHIASTTTAVHCTDQDIFLKNPYIVTETLLQSPDQISLSYAVF